MAGNRLRREQEHYAFAFIFVFYLDSSFPKVIEWYLSSLEIPK